jgi:hypothetical protein
MWNVGRGDGVGGEHIAPPRYIACNDRIGHIESSLNRHCVGADPCVCPQRIYSVGSANHDRHMHIETHWKRRDAMIFVVGDRKGRLYSVARR